MKECFLTEDTYLGDIRNPLTRNRYSYCIGNPLFYRDPSGHDLKSFTQRVLFGDPKLAGTVKQKISEGDKWAQEVIREHEDKKNNFMDDTYDWVGDHFPIKNNTTYGQIHNNFTAGVAGSVYNTVDMVTSPEYLGAKAYSAAAHPKQILAVANMSGRDAARGLQGVAGKIKNKEYGSLARSAGYVAGSAAQAYALGKGIEKCGDLINKKKYGTGTYADGMPLEDAEAFLEGGTSTLAQYGDDFGKMGTYVENPNIKVDWTQYAEHAAERMQQRGMTQEMVNNIVENGKVLSQNNGNKFAYITQEGVAIVSKEGKLITAWRSAHFDSSMLEIISKLFGE